jgi:ABC-type oligopeptide transport system substrate-binding subunit
LDAYFISDPRVAYTVNRAGRYDLDWDMVPTDQVAAKLLQGFQRIPQLETDVLFFDTARAPFNSTAVRQAFADALDKQTYASSTMQDSVTPADTLFPPAMPGYQAQAATYNTKAASALLKSAYPNLAKLPAITFTYPDTLVSSDMATALQGMWQKALGIQVNLQPLASDVYSQEMDAHDIQFGFAAWTAQVDDPADFSARLLSNSTQNAGQWHNSAYDQLVTQAEAKTGVARLQMYHQAEQIALNDAAIIPLDHQETTALIPTWVEGISVNAEGLYFGDWSQVKILNHKS